MVEDIFNNDEGLSEDETSDQKKKGPQSLLSYYKENFQWDLPIKIFLVNQKELF